MDIDLSNELSMFIGFSAVPLSAGATSRATRAVKYSDAVSAAVFRASQSCLPLFLVNGLLKRSAPGI